MQPFLAMIIPVGSGGGGGGGPVDPGYGKPMPPDMIWGGRPPSGNWPGWGPPPAWYPGHPAHPIPPGIWPNPPGEGGGGEQPPYYPAHPIFYPPNIWGPNDPRPTPPINLPPWGWTGGRPPGTWGGAGEPFPTPPIVIPPNLRPPEGTPEHPINEPPVPAPPGYVWRFVYAPLAGGWIWVLVPEKSAESGQQTPTPIKK